MSANPSIRTILSRATIDGKQYTHQLDTVIDEQNDVFCVDSQAGVFGETWRIGKFSLTEQRTWLSKNFATRKELDTGEMSLLRAEMRVFKLLLAGTFDKEEACRT